MDVRSTAPALKYGDAVRHRLAATILLALAALAFGGCGGGSDSTSTSPSTSGGSTSGGSGGGFEPHATLTAVGGTVRTDKPRFDIEVIARPGDANIKSAAVDLPPVVLIDTTAIRDLCTRQDLKSERCAGHQEIGHATILSPAFNGALSGPVYAVTGYGGLPHLAYVLSGPTSVVLEGRVVSKGGRIEAGIDDVPDTPLHSFELDLAGGKNGYLVLSRNICGQPSAADGTFTSQDGQTHTETIPLQAECGG